MAIRVVCDICQRTLGGQPIVSQSHFCERCAEHAEEFRTEAERIVRDGMANISRQVERFRAAFLADKILKRKAG